MKKNQKTFFATYLLALLDAPLHKQAIPHFRVSKFYIALMEGKPYVKRIVRKKQPGATFAFGQESGQVPECHDDDQMSEDSVSIFREGSGDSGGESSTSTSSSGKSSATGQSSSVHSAATSLMGSEGGADGDVVKLEPAVECALLPPDCTHYWNGFKFTGVYTRHSSHMS